MSERPTVEIRVFGAFSLLLDGAPQHLAIAGATRSLLQYLVCFPERPMRRDLLVELFWPQVKMERRRAALNSAIWRIKKALAPFAGIRINATAHAVSLSIEPDVRCDMISLARAVHGASEHTSPEAVSALAKALDVCAEPLLDGLDDNWAVIERERLSEVQLRGLTLMMHSMAELKRYEDALDYGRRILAIDPFRESTIQEVMCLCALSGQRVKALRLYQRFAASLEEELGIAPMAETIALYDHLTNDRAFEATPRPRDGAKEKADMRLRLDDRLLVIERARLDLYRSLRAIPA
ncbi:MAG: BTAD domain-containing putative transcriptional regulator [Pseudomonadota bacterium]